MAENTLARFQFSLADVLVGIGSLALATLCVSSAPQFKFDRDDALIRVFIASLLSVIVALFYRRAMKSDSPWFIPPFVLAGVCVVLLRFLRQPWDVEITAVFAAYVILFCSAAAWLHASKQKYSAPWLYAGVAFLVCGIITSGELRSQPVWVNTRITIDGALLLCRAQERYIKVDRDDDDVLEYAQTGLELGESKYSLGVDTTNGSPAVPSEDAVYYYRILKAQGPRALGGAKNYLDAKGNMTGGYAFVVYPAKYASTGRLTILVNNDGIYSKDLGATTKDEAESMTEFNPDSSWTKGLYAIR